MVVKNFNKMKKISEKVDRKSGQNLKKGENICFQMKRIIYCNMHILFKSIHYMQFVTDFFVSIIPYINCIQLTEIYVI